MCMWKRGRDSLRLLCYFFLNKGDFQALSHLHLLPTVKQQQLC